ncbi:MAG: SLC13/DASS family transporter [Deltaproteobacteria bacterium]|nr:SLC13/DASS family transporter [Deltaproteobacteria bacterium]
MPSLFERHRLLWIFLFAGAALGIYFLLPASLSPISDASGLSASGRTVTSIAALMAILWVTEMLPLAVTALLPLVLFPLFGTATPQEASTSYADRTIFLFFGGFILAAAMQQWNLHQRFALTTLSFVGPKLGRIVAAFMAVTAFISLWVSNTATAAMMFPIALSTIELFERHAPEQTSTARRFSVCMMLGIAYAASIGGLGTLIGTAPNALFAAFVHAEYGTTISFRSWLTVGLPLVVLLLPFTWLILTKIAFRLPRHAAIPESAGALSAHRNLGPITPPERMTLAVFVITAGLWIFRLPLEHLIPYFARVDDAGIAMAAALACFALPACDGKGSRLIPWNAVEKIPWGVLLLLGGGLSLAKGLSQHGVTTYVSHHVASLQHLPPFLLILLVAALTLVITEFASNTATAATLFPLLAALAAGMNVNPYLLLIPATLASSCGFMMPAGTPPNAIIFASNRLTVKDMCKAGILIDLLAIVLISIVAFFFAA